MWALGIILFELYTKERPKLIDIKSPKKLEIPSDIPPLIKTLIEKLLIKNPANRPTAQDILMHPEMREHIFNVLKKFDAINVELANKIFEHLSEILQ